MPKPDLTKLFDIEGLSINPLNTEERQEKYLKEVREFLSRFLTGDAADFLIDKSATLEHVAIFNLELTYALHRFFLLSVESSEDGAFSSSAHRKALEIFEQVCEKANARASLDALRDLSKGI